MKEKNFDIEEHEQDILNAFEQGEFSSVPNLKQEMKLANEAAKNFIKRDSRINLRVSGTDLKIIRKIALEEGLPYQTLLASIIHKFAIGRLVDKNQMAFR